MFIELVDALRCPVPHEESWLVVAADQLVARHIIEGTLGCPVCTAAYPIHQGIVDFTRGGHQHGAPPAAASAQEAGRLAAFLNLDDGLGFATLLGAWGTHALELRALVECPLVVIDPPADVEAAPGLSIIRTSGQLPLAAGSTRGIALDMADLHGDHPARLASAVLATRAAGRVLGLSSLAVPDGVRELARDDTVWVGERAAPSAPLVTLHVRRAQ